MRLIILARVPGQVEPFPLDVIDERPIKDVLEEIVRLTPTMHADGDPRKLHLSKGGKRLDPNLTFYDNGVRNGHVVDLISMEPEISTYSPSETPEPAPTNIPIKPARKTKSEPKTGEENNSASIPGVKIDFD